MFSLFRTIFFVLFHKDPLGVRYISKEWFTRYYACVKPGERSERERVFLNIILKEFLYETRRPPFSWKYGEHIVIFYLFLLKIEIFNLKNVIIEFLVNPLSARPSISVFSSRK